MSSISTSKFAVDPKAVLSSVSYTQFSSPSATHTRAIEQIATSTNDSLDAVKGANLALQAAAQGGTRATQAGAKQVQSGLSVPA